MRFRFARYALLLTLLPGMAAAVPARAAGQAPAADGRASAAAPRPSSSSRSDLTAKERLGAKWTDEQRVDNCKVPVDKRGPKPRPDTCATARPR